MNQSFVRESVVNGDSEFREAELFFAPEELNQESVLDICGLLSTYQDNPDYHSIALWISSHGGDLTAGLALYDYIQSMRKPIITKAYGHVGSAAVIALLASSWRIASPHSFFLIHRPYRVASEDDVLDKKTLEDTLHRLDRSYRRMWHLFLSRCSAYNNKKRQKLMQHWMDLDSPFPASIAFKMGLVHEISYPKKPARSLKSFT